MAEAKKDEPRLLIEVTDAEKRKNSEHGESFMAYSVHVKPSGGKVPMFDQPEYTVWRRFNEFNWLRQHLVLKHPEVVVPPLPSKRVLSIQKLVDNFGPEFVEERRVCLQRFLRRLAQHPLLSADDKFHQFMQLDSLSTDGGEIKARFEENMKRLAVAFKLKYQDSRFVDLKNYSDALSGNFSLLLAKYEKLNKRSLSVYQEFGNLAPVFSDWSLDEPEFGDVLQSTGHFMDNVSLSINERVEEENEKFVVPVKEYILFTDSLRAVIKKQEELEYLRERQEDLHTKKTAEMAELKKTPAERSFSFSALSARMFGDYPPEVLAQKVADLEQQVAEAYKGHEEARRENDRFSEAALKEIAYFNDVQLNDFRVLLQGYIRAQIAFSKKSISSWTNLKSVFDTMQS